MSSVMQFSAARPLGTRIGTYARYWVARAVALLTAIFLCGATSWAVADDPNFSGSWNTKTDKGWTYTMNLTQDGDTVDGTYISMRGDNGTITGQIDGNELDFTWTQGDFQGTGQFSISDDNNSFAGTYETEDNGQLSADLLQGVWTGTKSTKSNLAGVDFEGVWLTTTDKGWKYIFVVTQQGAQVSGTYTVNNPNNDFKIEGTGSVVGKVKGRTLKFNWHQGNYDGKGQFTMNDAGDEFSGVYSTVNGDDLPPEYRQGTWNGKKSQ